MLEILFLSVLSEIPEWKPLTYAEKISFSMYLTHPIVLRLSWVVHHQGNWYDQFFAWFFLVHMLATASSWAAEYPSQRFAQYISAKLRAWELQAAASSLPQLMPVGDLASPHEEAKGSPWCHPAFKPVSKFT